MITYPLQQPREKISDIHGRRQGKVIKGGKKWQLTNNLFWQFLVVRAT